MLKTFFYARYKVRPGDLERAADTMPFLTRAEAEEVVAAVNRAEPWRCCVLAEVTVNVPPPPPPPVCGRCGAAKVCDLFKGEYCPRCNDWV